MSSATFENYSHIAKFPGVNATAKFTLEATLFDGYYNNGVPKMNLGCHIAVLSNMYLKLAPSTIMSLDGNPLPKKNSEFHGYDGTNWLHPSIRAYVMPEEDKIKIWEGIIRKIAGDGDTEHPRGFSFIVMSDNMNSYSKTFPNNSGVTIPDVLPKFKTSDFVNYLVANKIGIVTASPIARNQFHQSGSDNFSMTQAFIWIPPHFCPTAAPNTAFHSNLGILPDEKQWRKMVAIKSGHADNDKQDEKIWRDGKSLINRADVA